MTSYERGTKTKDLIIQFVLVIGVIFIRQHHMLPTEFTQRWISMWLVADCTNSIYIKSGTIEMQLIVR